MKPHHALILTKIYDARYDWTTLRFGRLPYPQIESKIRELYNKQFEKIFDPSEVWMASDFELWAAIDALSDVLIRRGGARF